MAGDPPRSLSRLLRPASVAVIGGSEAERVIQQCERIGFAGPIWPVNPRRESLAGRPCFADVDALPEAPDATFIAVPAEPSIEIVAALAARGAGGAICYASGFDEVGGEGKERQRRLVEAAASGPDGAMPVIGPNCHGTINYLDGVALWPDQHGGARAPVGGDWPAVAFVTQSGNMAINVSMQQRGLPLAYVLSLGNQASIGIPECIEALLEDERVRAIGLHIEGLRDIAAFERAALSALDRGVALVALKTGRSEAGARLTLSHTASLGGSDALFDALFARLGVARLHDLPSFLEALKLLAVCGPLRGRRIASMSCSGGEASLMADLASDTSLVFPELSEQHRASVQVTLNDFVAVSNPLDYHTFIWGQQDKLAACFGAMMGGGFDASLIVLDFPRLDRCDDTDWLNTIGAIEQAAETTGATTAVVASLPECLPEAIAGRLAARGIVPLYGMAEALSALEAAATVGQAQSAPRPAHLLPLRPGSEPRPFDEMAAKSLLREAGIAVPDGRRAGSAEEAVEAARSLGGKLALKALSPTLAHKTEAGAVVLGLSGPDEIAREAARLLPLTGELLIERMVEGAVAELIVGLERDPRFGPYLLVGSGGVLVELLRDSRTLLLPTTEAAVEEALMSLRLAPLLEGFRGKPAGDVGAAVGAILTVARLAAREDVNMTSLDINPLMVLPAGQGVVAADAYIEADTTLEARGKGTGDERGAA